MTKINYKQSKEKIKKLVERYEKLSEAEKKRYNERQTEDHFIRPLFEVLGWNFERDVWPETDVSGKRVDYAFRIDGVTKFFIEAKAIPVNLDEERWAKQAINYSWHKSVPWVILTDFEAIKVFNTEWDEPNIQSCQFIEIPYKEYLTNEKLWWLSKEFFQKGILEKEADKISRRPKKIIDDQLAKDLIKWRELLRKDLEGYNPKIDKQKIAEYVQKILDRLIFIRTLEDRKIEDVVLQPLVRKWREKKGIKANQLLLDLNRIFRRIDSIYNSGLFEKGACDFLGEKIEADDNTFIEIINELYKTKDKGIRYNFADIPADIFGSIYEQYLGHIQKKNGENKTSKRKSQGIYYTPRYIVSYIVQNTLGEILKEKSPTEIRNLKILDPACGSGSFLITAYQTLIDYWQEQEKKQFRQKSDKLRKLEKAFKKRNGFLISPQEKMRILRDNIFGVDLDKEAVELAKLNLLLKMVGSKIKLPKLEDNIQEGNSLISGSEKELKKYFGKNWKEKKPFEWKEKFSFCHSQSSFCHSRESGNPGFDVVIGNPPYISFYSRESFLDQYKNELKWLISNYNFTKQYKDRRLNTVMFFIERNLNLLKDGGYLGLIIDANFLEKPFRAIRKYIENSGVSIKISKKISVFEGVGSDQVILLLQKQDTDKKKSVGIIDYNIGDKTFNISNIKIKRKEFRSDILNLKADKITLNFQRHLCDIADITTGIQIGIGGTRIYNNKKIVDLFYNEKSRPGFYKNISLKSEDFYRYSTIQIKNYINLDEKLAYEINKKVSKCNIAVTKAERYKDVEKIFIRQSSDKITATYGYKNQVSEYSAFMLTAKNPFDIKYILALLNSKLLTFYALQENIILTGGKKQPQIRIKGLKQLPLPNTSEKQKKTLSKLADKMLKLNKELQKLDPVLDEEEYKEIKEEIDKTDGEIDERVFELYRVREGERNRILKI